MPANHPSPLFIVGSPRSGTSILTMALHAVGYHGYNEGNFLGLLSHLHRITDNHFKSFGTDNPRVMMSRFNRQEIKGGLSDLLKRFTDRENPVSPWLDKSGNPELINAIPTLLELWPSAHFIFAKRRGIENIVSRRRKFPGHSFEYHCKDWVANMAAWRVIRRDLPSLRCIEVEQRDMIAAPIVAGEQITTFLGFSAGEQAALVNTFQNERPQQTSTGTTERLLTLQTAGWLPQDVDMFLTLCKTEMDAFGYSLDETYKTRVSNLKGSFVLERG